MRILARLIHLAGDARLERLFSRPELERALFGALARRFDPRAAPGFHGHVVYELERPASAGPTTLWTLAVAEQRALVIAGAVPDAALRLRMPVADFLRVAVGAFDRAEPVLQNRAKAKGDLALAARLPEMFKATGVR
jgi:hypothetical protein